MQSDGRILPYIRLSVANLRLYLYIILSLIFIFSLFTIIILWLKEYHPDYMCLHGRGRRKYRFCNYLQVRYRETCWTPAHYHHSFLDLYLLPFCSPVLLLRNHALDFLISGEPHYALHSCQMFLEADDLECSLYFMYDLLQDIALSLCPPVSFFLSKIWLWQLPL